MINTSNFSVSQEDERPRVGVRRKGTREFNTPSFESCNTQTYQNAENFYIEYEIDSVEEEFGELHRIWSGRDLLGTFYQVFENKWKANPFYESKQWIKLDRDLSQIFESSPEAIAYIKSTYEPKALSTL